MDHEPLGLSGVVDLGDFGDLGGDLGDSGDLGDTGDHGGDFGDHGGWVAGDNKDTGNDSDNGLLLRRGFLYARRARILTGRNLPAW